MPSPTRAISAGPGSPSDPTAGHPAGHRLDVRDAERLVDARHDERLAAARALERGGVLELTGELDAVLEAELTGERRQRPPLGPVADDQVAQVRAPLAQGPQRAQHVGVALAGDEVADGHERRRSALLRARRRAGRCPGARRGCARRPAPASARAMPSLLASTSRAAPNACSIAARPSGWCTAVWKTSAPCSEMTSGVRDARAQHRVGGGNGVVRVDELERERVPQAPEGAPQRRRRPRAPAPVGAALRRRDVAHVGDGDAVEVEAPRVPRERQRRGRAPQPRRRRRRDDPVQHDDVDVGARRLRRPRLLVRPDAEHRVVGARVELGDDEGLHRWARSVRTASRVTYGRPSRKPRASAIASSRG